MTGMKPAESGDCQLCPKAFTMPRKSSAYLLRRRGQSGLSPLFAQATQLRASVFETVDVSG